MQSRFKYQGYKEKHFHLVLDDKNNHLKNNPEYDVYVLWDGKQYIIEGYSICNVNPCFYEPYPFKVTKATIKQIENIDCV